ncbi:MAG: hypothetical protein K0R03_4 [Moraxellaceae bacterium]|nr:hypothetical protein [Moraxellaceae bacterium]
MTSKTLAPAVAFAATVTLLAPSTALSAVWMLVASVASLASQVMAPVVLVPRVSVKVPPCAVTTRRCTSAVLAVPAVISLTAMLRASPWV